MVTRTQSGERTERGGYPASQACNRRSTTGGVEADRPREPRLKVFLRGRMQTGECWVDLTIHNVSSRGLMAQCGTALERGRYVEVRCGSHVLVGRVVWCGAHRFGLRTRDIIDLPHLLGKTIQALPAGRTVQTNSLASSPSRRTATEQHATNRQLSRMLQFAWIASLALASALLLAGEVRKPIAKPLETAATAMSGADPHSSQTAVRRH